MRVILDPGHGGATDGVVAGGIVEDTYTLQTALHVERLIQGADYPINVHLTRRRDEALSLEQRARLADGYDLAISIHVNANDDQRVDGPMAWHSKHALARKTADQFLAACNRIGHGVQEGIQKPRSSLAIEDNPRTWPRVHNVLQPYTVPVVLYELGFATSPVDAVWLSSPGGQRVLAVAILSSIVRALEITEGGT